MREYLAILIGEQEIHWRRLTIKGYKLLAPDSARIWKLRIFPGLRLDRKAMLTGDAAKVLATLQQGLLSPAHQTFVMKLAKKKAQSK